MVVVMEQYYVVSLSFIQVVNQCIEVKSVIFRIIISVFMNFQICRVKDVFMVWLVWVVYLYMFNVGIFCQEIGSYVQCVSVFWSLCCVSMFVIDQGVIFIKQQFLSVVIKFRDVVNVEVIFGGFIFEQILFSFFYVGQYWGFVCFIFIDINFEVNFVGMFIGMKQIGQVQNWVGRSGGNVFKYDEVLLWLQKGSLLLG